MKSRIAELAAVVGRIRQQRYAGADVILLAGSVVRGQGTATSDLDLVVLFERLPQAYRESLHADGWPVEAFVHDPDTLRYFFLEHDRAKWSAPDKSIDLAAQVLAPHGGWLFDGFRDEAPAAWRRDQ